MMFEVQPEEEFFWAVPLISKRTGWLLGNCFWRAGFEAAFELEWRRERGEAENEPSWMGEDAKMMAGRMRHLQVP